MIRPLFLTLILSSAFFTSPAAGQGSVETVTGNYGYTQYRYSGGNAQVIDASNATFVQQNRDGLNPYPFRVSNARPGLVISGGTIAGEVSQTEAWRPLYNRGNSTGMLIENVPNVVISNWRIDGAWDAIRPRGSDNFVIENTRITNVRDDAVENDDGTNGTIRNSIFDGVFVGISLADEGTPSSARNNLVTLDNVAIRMQNFLYDHNGPPRMTHQSPFKVTDRSPRLLVNNSIIAIQNPNHAGFSRLQTAWNKMIGGSGNVYLNLSDTPLPSNYPRPPSSGWTVLQGQEARDYWQENVGTAVNSTPIGGGPVAAFVPQISDTQGQDILTDLLQTQNFDDAVEGLASVSDLSIPEAEELLNSIIEIPDLNLSSGGQLLDGFIEGRLDVSELGTIVDTLDGIQETLNDPEILNTLIGN
ncbi:MAG: right-handed parallel beta-helix repeat-containing protein, partial [Pseudomonadota bacterium]